MKNKIILSLIIVFSFSYASAKETLMYSFKTKEMVKTSIDKPILVVQEDCHACDALMQSYKHEIEAKKILVVAMFEPSKEWVKEKYYLDQDIFNYLGVKEKIGFKGSVRATPALITEGKTLSYGAGKILAKLGIKQK